MLLALLILTAASTSYAAPVNVQLGGLGRAQSVIAVVRDAATQGVGACNDAGAAPDAAADGVWSCQPVEMSGHTAEVLALVDGRLVSAGVLSWDAGEEHVAAIAVAAGIVQVSKDPATLPKTPGGPAAPGLALVLARLDGYGGGPAPVLVIGPGASQLYCHDDGQFPDRQVNDGEPGCSGPVASQPTDLTLHSGDGKLVPVGKLTWMPGPIQYVTVDVKASTSSSAPFDLPLPPLPQLALAPPPVDPALAPPPVDPAAQGATGAAAAGASSDAVGQVGEAAASSAPSQPPADTAPVHATGAGATFLGPWPWIIGALCAVVGVVGLRLRGGRASAVRRTLRPHPAPPVFPGGPAWGEASVFRVEQPVAFFTELVGTIAQQHRVVVALPGLIDLPPVAGAGVWVAMVPTWEEVAAGVVGLARTDGAPVAVLVLGAASLTDPGAVVPEPISKLSHALPPGVWLGVVVAPAEVVAAWLPAWRVSGPPWTGARVQA